MVIPVFSVIIPVYRNEEFVPLLIQECERIAELVTERFGIALEVVFVVDASPDRSHALLKEALPKARFRSQLLLHARNFGSFSAIRTGLQAAKGAYLAVIAADLQEPPDLLVGFLEALVDDKYDIVVGVREQRSDPLAQKISANLFWQLYRGLINPQIPRGGVDVFGCNDRIRKELLALRESNSSLVGLVYWLGFRRTEVSYARRARAFGKSSWTLSKKITYLLDSVFAFTDLPVRILSFLGAVGVAAAAVLGLLVTALRLLGNIEVPGYTPTVLAITFFGGLNTLGLGLVGSYAWRAYENTKQRPLALIQSGLAFAGSALAGVNPSLEHDTNHANPSSRAM